MIAGDAPVSSVPVSDALHNAPSGTTENGAGYLAGLGALLGVGRAISANEIITLGARYRRQNRNLEIREDENDIADILAMSMKIISKLH